MSENLIAITERLVKREAIATQRPWAATEEPEGEFVIISNPDHWIFKDPSDYPPATTNDALLISELRNNAPDILQVLKCFQEGDAGFISEIVQSFGGEQNAIRLTELEKECLHRLQKAAQLMEALK
jgi:hypothetical protein